MHLSWFNYVTDERRAETLCNNFVTELYYCNCLLLQSRQQFLGTLRINELPCVFVLEVLEGRFKQKRILKWGLQNHFYISYKRL